jgi:flagellar motor switch protein FliN/FliY
MAEQQVKEPEFQNIKEEKKEEENGNEQKRDIEFLLDIPVEITVQLGSTRMMIKELLQLGQGSVIELDKLAGEPMEVLVNNKLIARGEVVVVNEKFGIRLTDIVSPSERLSQLK